jgi:hypothetical protein
VPSGTFSSLEVSLPFVNYSQSPSWALMKFAAFADSESCWQLPQEDAFEYVSRSEAIEISRFERQSPRRAYAQCVYGRKGRMQNLWPSLEYLMRFSPSRRIYER